MKMIAFFNNKGGVGKTSLVYHLAWLYQSVGINVLAVDLDPQANLTSMFLTESRLDDLWSDNSENYTIYNALQPLIKGTGDIRHAHIEPIEANLNVLAGDLALSGFEDQLSESWPKCLDGDERSFRIISAFYRLAQQAARAKHADVVLIDVGPNLGAINRSALIATDYIVIPLAPDLFSLQGLKNLGPVLSSWRKGWVKRLDEIKEQDDLPLPKGTMLPLGYIIMQHGVRSDRPVQAYQKWADKIPIEYQKMMNECADTFDDGSDNCLALLKHYRSLMPMAMTANKPMFQLKPADGAIGAHTRAVQSCYNDFLDLAKTINLRANLKLPIQ